ncbi:MAG: Type 1 glutamine amidotransferase-like domain-containing protein [Patescibacteria group bacterium]
MKKLFLASAFSGVVGEFVEFLGKDPQGLTVGFVPTAADPYDDKWFVEKDKKALVDMGVDVKEIDLKDKAEAELRKEFKGVDIIFVAGGNTFYLLNEARKSGFDKIVKELVEQGVVYAGSSAGSYLVCPTIEASNWKPADKPRFGVTDLTAINLAPFIMTAHFTPEYADIIKQAASSCQYPVKILTDQQAMVVVDDKITLVGQDEEVILGTH